jgi:hypothetical protein
MPIAATGAGSEIRRFDLPEVRDESLHAVLWLFLSRSSRADATGGIRMTNAIGTGTANITYNAPVDEAMLLGRVASDRNTNRSEFIREAIAFWFQANAPDEAQRLRQIRDAYRGAAMLLLLGASLLCGSDFRARPLRPIKTAKTASIRRFEEA